LTSTAVHNGLLGVKAAWRRRR